jgi:hypothetical protein
VSFRIATIFLIMITLGFFLMHALEQKALKPHIIESIAALPMENEKIIDNEFLVLFEEGKEKYINETLDYFGMYLVAPLEQWILVAKRMHLSKTRLLLLIQQ